MDRELKRIKEYGEKEARKTQFYKRLIQRTYRRVKGYQDYKQVAVELAVDSGARARLTPISRLSRSGLGRTTSRK